MKRNASSKGIQLPPRHQLLTSLALAWTAAIASADPAQAVQINFSYGSGMTSDQMVGMEIAGEIWSSYLTDDATVNIHVETTDGLPEGVVGGALPGIETKLQYKEYRSYLNANQSSLEDRIATETLSSQGDELKTVANGYEIKDDNKYINLTRANAKAVGLSPRDNEELDGYILVNPLENSGVDWSYDFLGEEVPDGEVDFVSVALHEIGHSLGFVSGVDSPGWLEALAEAEQSQSNKDQAYAEIYRGQGKNNATYPFALDLFRYSPESAERGYNDISVGGKKFFSLDGGLINLADFSTGEGGDGFQASHWKLQDDNPLGIMDPLIRSGQKRNILKLDTTVMDVIGWGIDSGEYDLSALLEEATEEVAAIEFQDLSEEVEQMIKESEVYEWGWSSRGRGGTGVFGWWQGLMKQHFLWQEIETTESASAETVSVPEPSSTVGLLGLGVGLGWLRKSRKKK